MPLSYDALVRPSLRAALSAEISQPPANRRAQLAAIVNRVRRDPPFGAVTQIRATLSGAFNTIDLRLEDPDFQVEKLTPQAVAGVSFALPPGDRLRRLAALRQFTGRRFAYKQRRTWASVTNVRDLEGTGDVPGAGCAVRHRARHLWPADAPARGTGSRCRGPAGSGQRLTPRAGRRRRLVR